MRTDGTRHTIKCNHRRPVTLFEDVPSIFDELSDHGFPVAYASRTWEPEWAKSALREFSCGTGPVKNMWSIASGHGWGDVSKVSHFREISKQLAMSMRSMIFFDNEMRNIRDIEPLGATCAYCPEGLTWDIFEAALDQHRATLK